MEDLEVIVRMKIRTDEFEGFRSQVAEVLRATRDQDSHTLRCDWFVNEARTECEVHEMFPDERGLVEHKAHTMAATGILFRDYAFDHDASIYGDVSPAFIDMVTERMGSPAVFTFAHGLASPATDGREFLEGLEVIARLKVRPGQLDGFEASVAEILRLTRETDERTLRYDWFVNEDHTEFEVHETYIDEQGLIEHNEHVLEARTALFRDHAFDHRMSVYGEISPRVHGLFEMHAGGVGRFSHLLGLSDTASVSPGAS